MFAPFGAITVGETFVEINDECTLCGMCLDTCEFGALSLPELGDGKTVDVSAYSGIWVYAEWRGRDDTQGESRTPRRGKKAGRCPRRGNSPLFFWAPI